MAVQAHYRSSNTFSSGAGIGMRGDDMWEEFQFQPSGHRNLATPMMNVTVFSEPESELTCNASGGRKRPRDTQFVAAGAASKTQQRYHHHHHHHHQSKVQILDNLNFHEPGIDSGPASTSGRTEQLGFYRDLEFESLIRFQNQKLRSMVEEARKKQSMTILSMIEQRTLRKLVEKETELEKAKRLNMELEDKVKKMIGENQIWFDAAKNSEATVSSLRVALERVGNRVAGEGFGETDGGDEVESRYDRSENEVGRRSCRVCGGYDASFLVLPCRHLCLCGECELRVRCCPVCDAVKNSALEVFLG